MLPWLYISDVIDMRNNSKCLYIDTSCHIYYSVFFLPRSPVVDNFVSPSNNLCMSNTLTHYMSPAINAPRIKAQQLLYMR